MSDSIRDLWDLTGKTAVVIGGSKLLGYDMAAAFAEAGATVVVSSRNAASAVSAAETLAEKYNVATLGLAVNVQDYASIENAAADAIAFAGRIDVLVNNAGGGSGNASGDLLQRPVTVIEDMIATNLTGTLLCCKAFGAKMIEQSPSGGAVINIASIAGLVGRDRRMYSNGGVEQQPIDYAAAKAGVIGLSRDLAAAWAQFAVRVNSISPGGFGPRQLPNAFADEYATRTPLGRMGIDGQDIKSSALFLASEASAYITGHNLVVDGGFSSWR
ncbi:gluconate 5-dehydrogenase [Arthrobacter psychrolactophilus]|uniref:Gluconate 5-dehydrogenase n=1 Tax=Arthrobacter psychrolactophilus TaxID=92442 RepID=A0A2V5IS86_9MICC|nr:SDR family oxidoreductase [Arthrobacter psychrolactophilus]PYI39409.1 gluconate 5-dehydrogenase [Arthrobacter psychrolactophilus]